MENPYMHPSHITKHQSLCMWSEAIAEVPESSVPWWATWAWLQNKSISITIKVKCSNSLYSWYRKMFSYLQMACSSTQGWFGLHQVHWWSMSLTIFSQEVEESGQPTCPALSLPWLSVTRFELQNGASETFSDQHIPATVSWLLLLYKEHIWCVVCKGLWYKNVTLLICTALWHH